MTHANINRMYFAALTVNGQKRIELGKALWPEITQRAFANLKTFPDEITDATITIGITKDSLARASKGGVQAEYAHAGLDPNSPLYGLDADVVASIQMIDDDTPSPFEGITMTRLMEAQQSPEYQSYMIFALHPDKRVGVDAGVISEAYHNWCFAYPDVSEHVPAWID